MKARYTIQDSDQYVTVRDAAGQPIGTITRPRTYPRTTNWTIADTSGTIVWSGPARPLRSLVPALLVK